MKKKRKLPKSAPVDQNFLKLPIPYYGRREHKPSYVVNGTKEPMIKTYGELLHGFDYENLIHEYAFYGIENKEGACRFTLPQLREIRGLTKGGKTNKELLESIKRQETNVFWIGSYHDYSQKVDFPIEHFRLWEEVHLPRKEDKDRRIILTPPLEILMNLHSNGYNFLALERRDALPDLITRRLFDILKGFHTLKQYCNFEVDYLASLIPLIDSRPDRAKKKLFHHLDLLVKAEELDDWNEDKNRENHIFTYKRHQSKWKHLIPEYKKKKEY